MQAVQYLTDSNGTRTSVVISIEDWMRISEYMQEIQVLERIGKSAKAGLIQAKAIEAGETQPSESTQDFLDGL